MALLEGGEMMMTMMKLKDRQGLLRRGNKFKNVLNSRSAHQPKGIVNLFHLHHKVLLVRPIISNSPSASSLTSIDKQALTDSAHSLRPRQLLTDSANITFIHDKPHIMNHLPSLISSIILFRTLACPPARVLNCRTSG